MKKILITGASGFIASNLANRALRKGYRLYLQSRTVTKELETENYCFINKSFELLSPSDFVDLSCIIHLASAGVSPQKASWATLEAVNVAGNLAMCELAKSLNVPLIIAGSFSEYGESGLHYDEIPVDAPLRPTFPYAISKAAGCSIALGYAKCENIALGYLRIFNAYGPGQFGENLWPSLVDAAKMGRDFDITPGEQIRDFIHVDKIADKFISIIENNKLKSGIPYVRNIASGKPQMIKSFCQDQWARYSIGGNLIIGGLPYRPSEVMRYVPSMEPKYL